MCMYMCITCSAVGRLLLFKHICTQHAHTHTQAIGVVMFAFGIFVIVDLNQYGFFTEEYYIAGAVVFILVGVVKMVFGVVGVIAMFGKWRRVLGVVSLFVSYPLPPPSFLSLFPNPYAVLPSLPTSFSVLVSLPHSLSPSLPPSLPPSSLPQ